MNMKIEHDPGGLVRTKLTDDTMGTAIFGGLNNEYRYRLGRTWQPDGDKVMFVMMNPSTADPLVNDPTVAKCCRLAKKWGFSGLNVGNTFAYRATDQSRLLEVDDPIGPDNEYHLIEMAKEVALVVFAYGTPKQTSLWNRGTEVVNLLKKEAGIQPTVLKLSEKNNRPWHPLYIPETIIPVLWNI